jgi:hypothetical protein
VIARRGSRQIPSSCAAPRAARGVGRRTARSARLPELRSRLPCSPIRKSLVRGTKWAVMVVWGGEGGGGGGLIMREYQPYGEEIYGPILCRARSSTWRRPRVRVTCCGQIEQATKESLCLPRNGGGHLTGAMNDGRSDCAAADRISADRRQRWASGEVGDSLPAENNGDGVVVEVVADAGGRRLLF